MSAVLTRRETLPESCETGAVTDCAACGERVMLVAREGRETARIECTACGVSMRVVFTDGAALFLNQLRPFALTRDHRPRPRSRAALYRLFDLPPPNTD